MLDARQERILQGRLYHLEAILARQPRRADECSYSLFYNLHRQLFAGIFPEQAGKERLTEVGLGAFPVPTPGQIKDRLRYLIEAGRSLIEESVAMMPSTERTAIVFARAAAFHADSVVIQPFL